MPNLINLSTGKPFTRRSALKGLAAIIAAGVSPSVVSASTGGLRRGLGARLGMMGGGGWTNPYVTDGLVAMWDGEWNAGGGIHDASTGTITELCGSGNYLSSGGSVTINQNNFYSTISGWWTSQFPISIPFPSTIETVFSSVYSNGFIACYSSGGGGNSRYIFRGSQKIQLSNEQGGTSGISDSVLSPHTTSIINLSVDYISNTYNISAFSNNVELTRTSFGDYWPSSNVPCFFCRPPYRNNSKVTSKGSQPLAGSIFCSRIYSRLLSNTERSLNYAVDKARFGLT